ncbi:hypothetical protein LOTGIDRAFT_69309, partial [Lottia gigantea]
IVSFLIEGIFGSSGKVWKEQRKFAVETLREFGFGRTMMEDKIYEEIAALVEAIRQKNGVGFDMCRLIHVSVFNVICSIVFGERFDYNNKALQLYLNKAEENFQYHRTINNVYKANATLVEPAIEEHLKNYDEDNTDDFISCYLKEM